MKTGFSLRISAVLLGIAAGASAQNPTLKQAKSVANKAEATAGKLLKTTGRTVKHTARSAGITARNLAVTPSWSKLLAAYDYDSKAAPDVKEEPQDNDTALQINLTFTGPNGKEVEGVFLRPKAEGVYPCALLPHGLTNDKETAIKMFGNKLVAKGVAVLALDAPEHGKQRVAGKNMWTEQVITVAVYEGDRNYRRALDYLTARTDIDKSRIGLVGYSLGSIMGSILGAVDKRVTAFAFCVGGDPFLPIAHTVANAKRREAIYDVSPSLFIGHIAPRPIIMFNGRTDAVVVAPAALLLQRAAKSPRQVVWYNSGHDVPASIQSQAVAWMAKKLKAGTKPAPPKTDENKDAPKPDDTGTDKTGTDKTGTDKAKKGDGKTSF